MKSIITTTLLSILFVSGLCARDGAAMADSATGESNREVKGFIKDKITCYCTEARTKGLKLDKKELLNALKSKGQSTDILGCGEKELMLIKIPLGGGEDELDVDVTGTCYADVEPDPDGRFSCWIKKNYIKYNANCDSVDSAGDPNVENRPLCKDLGSVVGAGSCRKEK